MSAGAGDKEQLCQPGGDAGHVWGAQGAPALNPPDVSFPPACLPASVALSPNSTNG